MVQRVAPLIEVGRFTESGAGFQIAAPAGLRGSAVMTRLLVCDFTRPNSIQIIWGNSTSPATVDGWRYNLTGTAAQFLLSDGTSTLRGVTSSFVPVPGDRLFWWASWDGGAGVVRTRFNGVENSVSGGSGYTDSAQAYTVGSNPSLSAPARSFAFASLLASDSVALSFVQMRSAESIIKDALRNNRYITPAPGYDEAYLDARDIDFLNGTWTDRISGDVLTMNGTPEPQQRWAAL